MASAGRGKARTKQAKKHEIAERVQEIQMRQKNWMEQREVALKTKVNSDGKSATVEKKPETKFAPSPKPTKTTAENIASTSNHQMSKERFKSWMVARERKGKMDHGDYEEEDSADVLKSQVQGHLVMRVQSQSGKKKKQVTKTTNSLRS